jgi:hypothetical protein
MKINSQLLGRLQIGRWYRLARARQGRGRPSFDASTTHAPPIRPIRPLLFGKEWGQGHLLDALLAEADPTPDRHRRREVWVKLRPGSKKKNESIDWVLSDRVLVEQEWSEGLKKAVKQIGGWRRSGWTGSGVAIATGGKPGVVQNEDVGDTWCYLLRFAVDEDGCLLSGLAATDSGLQTDGSILDVDPPCVKGQAVGGTGRRQAGSVKCVAEVVLEPDEHGVLVALPIVRFRLNVASQEARASGWEVFWAADRAERLVLLDPPRHSRRTYDVEHDRVSVACEERPEEQVKARGYARWRLEGSGVPVGTTPDRARTAVDEAWREVADLLDLAIRPTVALSGSGLETEAEAYFASVAGVRAIYEQRRA